VLKRRSSKEILDVILGFQEDGSTSLAEFFDIHLLENGTALQIRLRKQYYINPTFG
jgi:hypothetical protein